MAFLGSPWALVVFVGVIAIGSMVLAPRKVTADGFFDGAGLGGAPSLWVLVLSQVTTWIFARSLMNAAILGYYYGIAGTLAYTAYYLSFLTGGFIVARMRAAHAGSVQHWLGETYGRVGRGTYNFVIGLRLLSEVFANLLVVGLIFKAAFPGVSWAETGSILILAAVGLTYSMHGGLKASLRTDVFQMLVFLFVFGIAFWVMIAGAEFSFGAVLTAEGVSDGYNGWVLLVVAFLQVFSYPAHDPVMMDRGFIADEKTTQQSFVLAFMLSSLCIFSFGLFGIQAALVGAEADLLISWQGMFGAGVYFLLAASLLVSAVSTLDSALASSARLAIEEWALGPRTVAAGRWAMVGFMVLGAALTLWENKTLFDAVAVSGTASMFLTPVLIFAFAGRAMPIWSYLVAYGAAIIGAAAYMFRSAEWVAAILPEGHKYEQLLAICIVVLAVGAFAGFVGIATRARVSA